MIIPDNIYGRGLFDHTVFTTPCADTFVSNPQYVVPLESADADDDDDLCTMVVSLMQKNVRQQRRFGRDFWPIGFTIYKVGYR